MARRGRKRKSGRRHPSGELVREARPDDRVRTSRQPHRRTVPEDSRLDQRAESPIGRLCLQGRITDEQHDAGVRYAAVVGAYGAVIEAPAGTSGSGRGFACLAEQAGTARACAIDPGGCECLARKARYDRAYEVLWAVGQRAAKAVARVAVWREECSRADLVYLVEGLTVLARHFGLTAGRRSGHSGNRN